ncbi:MAG: DNA primase [Bacilli bacterium]|nr:DNA primase [Bacilli bacterium]
MKDNVLTQDIIAKVQENVDIVDVISGYLPLSNKGKNFFGVCPFHSDHSPSMSVSREKQIYKCFSCGASGNVFNFVMNYENVSFIDAVKILASKAGIPLNIKTSNYKDNGRLQVLYDIFDVTQKFYKNNINTKDGEKALEFIKNRKFDLNIIKDFDLGLSLKEDDKLVNLLMKKGFNQTDMLRTGLVNKSERGLKDMYINRIMFPIYNLQGNLVGYSGRIFNGEKLNKYFNTKETEIFKKGEILYNYHRAKNAVKDKEQVIVVEGFFATIRLHTIGVDNVVATLGTAFTKNHASILKRMAKEIVLCFDGDNAGSDATNSCIKELEKVGVIPKIIRLEDNLDPDDYVLKYGKDRMLEKINNPMNIMDYKLNYYKKNKDLTNTQDLSKYVNEMIDELKLIDDDIYRELTLKKLSDISKISVEILKQKLDDIEVATKIPRYEMVNKKLSKYDMAERNLLFYALNNKEIFKKIKDENLKFNNQEYINLIMTVNDYLNEHDTLKISSLLTYFRDNSDMINMLNSLIDLDLKDECSIYEINDYIKVIKERTTKKKMNNLKNNMKEASTKDEKKKLLEQMFNIRKKELEGANKND